MGKPSGRILFATPFVYTDPSVHVKFAKRYIDLGFDHLIFHAAGPDQIAFLEKFGRHVLPLLRAS